MARRIDKLAVGSPLRPPLGLLRVGPNRVTCGADHVALGDLLQQSTAGCEHGPRVRDLKRLVRRLAMVEVHLVWQKGATAVHARDPANITEECERGALPREDAIDLTLAITLVVLDVVGALRLRTRHSPKMGYSGEPCQ